jgi:type II secretory ATPase GspE/PulE/Tfp pilus assembly ATPase PilB-like protein
MGIEPYLVASSLISVLAQRLVRLLCPRCKKAFTPTAEDLREISVPEGQSAPAALHRAEGCEVCRSGYFGRTGVFELLPVDDEVMHQILDKVSASEIRQRAVAKGMRTLLSDGRTKVLDGLTTIEELVRVCQRDEI